MISFHFSISNPWAKDNFANLWHKDWLVAKHKAIELEFIRHAYDLFNVHISTPMRTDHAGVAVIIALFGYGLHFTFYDTRHWNYDIKAWEIHNE
jgi:hypothetical protein